MFREIKVLGKETLIYGISTVVARLLNFILLPLYTHYLSPDNYGIVATVFSIIAFLNVIYGFGINQGYMRFFKERNSLSISVSFVFISSFIFSILLILFSKPIALFFEIGTSSHLLIYSALILYFDSLTLIPLTDLRIKHRAYKFVSIKIFSIFLNILLNIVLLKYLKMGNDGIFIANILSSFAQCLFLTEYFKFISFKFDGELFKELFLYSIPYIPSSLSSVIIQLIDRPIMMRLTDSYTVGIYQANFRLSIFINLIVSMFDFAWRPFVMERFEMEGSKEIFKKVFDYFVVIVLFIWLLFSIFIEDIIHLSFRNFYLINPNYWSGVGIVPIVMLGYFFNGLYINFMIGSMITKKTSYIMYSNLLSAILSILLNFILIPRFNIYGAAFSILISYLFLCVFTYFVNQKLWKIDYNIKKNLLLFLFTIICFFGVKISKDLNPCFFAQFRLFIVIIYPLVVLASGYFSKEEIYRIKKIFVK